MNFWLVMVQNVWEGGERRERGREKRGKEENRRKIGNRREWAVSANDK